MEHDTLSLELTLHKLIYDEDGDPFLGNDNPAISMEDAKNSQEDLYLQGKLSINGIHCPHYLDFHCLLHYAYDSQTNKAEKRRKGHRQGSRNPWTFFEPLTSSCGFSDSVDIWRGIFVKNRRKTIEWRMDTESGYDFLGKRFFSFDRKHYDAVIGSLSEQILTLERSVGRKIILNIHPSHP